MTETSKLQKYLMWNKVNELFSSGLNKTQIGQVLGLHRQTVAKYVSMTEKEFILSNSYPHHISTDGFFRIILNKLLKIKS